jgi:hypothetical protein
MEQPVSVPLWLFLPIAAFAVCSSVMSIWRRKRAWPRHSSGGRLRKSKLGLFDYMLKSFDLKGRLPGTAPQRLVRVAPVLAYYANAMAHSR